MPFDDIQNYSNVILGYDLQDGNYCRPQEGQKEAIVGVSSEGFINLKNAYVWGAFNFAQKNLTDAYAGLDSVQEPDLIDSYIYQLNAAYLRYRVLLRDVKALTSDEVHQTPHIDSEIHIPTFDLETRALSDLSPGSNTF